MGIEVAAKDGVVFVKTVSSPAEKQALIRDMERIAKNIPGVKEVKTDVTRVTPYGTPYSD
jgi:osmotically-inducible protein OsmY